MRITRVAFPALLLLTAGASAVAVHLYQENQDLRRQLITRAAPPASAPRSVVEDAADRPAVATSAAIGSAGAAGSMPQGTAEDGVEARRRDDRRARGAEFFARMMNDPDARAAALGRMKSEIDRRYADLFIKLGLGEDQAEMLRTLLAERQFSQMEAGMAARLADNDEARSAARAAGEARSQSIEAGIVSLLGEDGLTVIADFESTAAQRQAASEVARRANLAGAPLSTEASDQLVAAMQTAAQEYPVSNDWGRRGGPVTAETVDSQLAALKAQNEAVLARARGFLSGAQLEALAARQVEQYEQMQLQLNVRLRNPDMPFGPPAGDFAGRGPGGTRP